MNTEVTQAVSNTSRITIWKVYLVTSDINHMDCHKPYQPYGLLQLHKPYTTHKQIYTHMHNGLACKVQGLHNAASTIAHSHCFAFTYNSLHKVKRTHRVTRLSKKVLTLIVYTVWPENIDTFSKGSDYSSACPVAIQIKRSLCRVDLYSVMVMRYAFYALGFRFDSHLADFGFVFFLSTFLQG